MTLDKKTHPTLEHIFSLSMLYLNHVAFDLNILYVTSTCLASRYPTLNLHAYCLDRISCKGSPSFKWLETSRK